MLNLSRVTTPEALSMEDDHGMIEQDESSDEETARKKQKPHHQYIVRTKKPPEYKYAKNKYDNYLTKTSMRAIKFSENKKRWLRLVENDLYSKTQGRGIPKLQRVEIKDNQFVKSPPFFRDEQSSRVSVSEMKTKNSQMDDSQAKI